MAEHILRLPTVVERTGLSRTTIYRLMRLGAFASPVRLGLRAVGWRASDVDAWIASRVTEVQ